MKKGNSVMRPEVIKSATIPETATVERCFIAELSNDDQDDGLSIARARVSPGITTALHKLDGVSERYIIVSGRGRMEMDGLDPVDVVAGDVVRIPAGTPQRITNTAAVDLVFYVLSTPRFSASCYVNLE